MAASAIGTEAALHAFPFAMALQCSGTPAQCEDAANWQLGPGVPVFQPGDEFAIVVTATYPADEDANVRWSRKNSGNVYEGGAAYSSEHYSGSSLTWTKHSNRDFVFITHGEPLYD